MTGVVFGYLAILDIRMTGRTSSLAAYVRSARGPLKGVIWNVSLRQWTFDPDVVARFLFDDDYEDRQRMIDRQTAEKLAEELGTHLPSEDELIGICEAATANEPPKTL